MFEGNSMASGTEDALDSSNSGSVLWGADDSDGASEVASTLNTDARSPRISSSLAPSRPTSNSTAASPPMEWPIMVIGSGSRR